VALPEVELEVVLAFGGGTTRRFGTTGLGNTTTSRTNAEDEDMEWDEFESKYMTVKPKALIVLKERNTENQDPNADIP